MTELQTYFKTIWLGISTALIGMRLTFRHLFTPAVTVQYPDVKLKLPERARNRLYVNMDDCIGCFQCDLACPVDCIAIETVKSLPTEDLGMTSTGQKKKLWVTKFDIDIAKCCYCGLCVYPCPTECIKMTDVYEFSESNRKNLIYNYVTVTPGEVVDIKARAAEFEKEQAAKKAAAAAEAAKAKAAAAATAPAAGTAAPVAGTTAPATPGAPAPAGKAPATPAAPAGSAKPPAPAPATPAAPAVTPAQTPPSSQTPSPAPGAAAPAPPAQPKAPTPPSAPPENNA